MLTAALQGFHQAPRDLPAVQTTAMLIVHCAAAFVQSTSRILRSLTLYSILKVSYHLLCQGKPAPRTRTVNTFHCGSNLQMLSENKIVDVTDMRSLAKLIRGSFLASQTPATLHDCFFGEGPRATRFLQALLHMLSSQLPSVLYVILDESNFGVIPCKLSPETHILPGLSSQPHPIDQHTLV